MDDEEIRVWHVRRLQKNTSGYFLSTIVGVFFSVPILYTFIYLVALYFDNVFKVFLWFFIIFTLTNMAIYSSYRTRPGKVYRHPTIGHAIHDGQPTAKLYIYGSYFCILLVLIAADDSPIREYFTTKTDYSRFQWFLFVMDNAIKAIIFDFAEIYNLQFSNIKPVDNLGKTIVFFFRTLLTISFFDFVLSVNRSWNTDRLMQANISGLRKDMKIKEIAERTLFVAPVEVGEYQPLYPSLETNA